MRNLSSRILFLMDEIKFNSLGKKINTKLDQLNQRRMLQSLISKLSKIASGHVGCLNSDQVAECVKTNVSALFNGAGINVNVEMPIQDELAQSCASYEEYAMKSVIATGDLPTASETQFWERHDPYNKYKMKVNIARKSPQKIKYVDVCFKLDEDIQSA